MICGSPRAASRSLSLLRQIALLAPEGVVAEVAPNLAGLPVFSPDLDAEKPAPVAALLDAIARADALVIASPEYVRSLPGALKNAIDWCVSGPELVGKPIYLAHASHRGDEMLTALARVLETVSQRFSPRIFLRLPLASLAPEDVAPALDAAGPGIAGFWDQVLADLNQDHDVAQDYPLSARNGA